MRSLRNIALASFLTMGAFGSVLYTSCNKDECKDVVCQNGGTCSAGNCSCPTGYEGSRCETASSAKFVDNWRTTNEVCTVSGANAQYDITVTQSSTDKTKILINNLYDGSTNVTATMTGTNTFTIGSQALGTATVSGTGSLTNDQIIISYTVTVGAASDVCSNVTFIRL